MAFIRFSLRCKIHQPEISIELMARALEQKFFMAGLKYSRLISPTKINETVMIPIGWRRRIGIEPIYDSVSAAHAGLKSGAPTSDASISVQMT